MNYEITHRTLYEYAAPVSVSQHVARLTPRVTAMQTCEMFGLEIAPFPTLRKTRTDYFGNELCLFSIQEVHQRLEITTKSRVSVQAHEAVRAENSPAWEESSAWRDCLCWDSCPWMDCWSCQVWPSGVRFCRTRRTNGPGGPQGAGHILASWSRPGADPSLLRWRRVGPAGCRKPRMSNGK